MMHLTFRKNLQKEVFFFLSLSLFLSITHSIADTLSHAHTHTHAQLPSKFYGKLVVYLLRTCHPEKEQERT